MPNDIQRKDLWSRLNNLDARDWIRAGKKLRQVVVSESYGKGSHAVFLDANNPNPMDLKALIATIQMRVDKQVSQSIFKHIIKFGIPEDDVWKALGFLK